MTRALGVALLVVSASAHAGPEYRWRESPAAGSLAQRFVPPAGSRRVELAPGTFSAWLRELPLEPAGTRVHLYDGSEKPRQDVHAAVVAIDVGDRDLQQCADAVMRLWAEYRFSRGEAVELHPDAGRARVLRYDPRAADPGRRRFRQYLAQVFAEAGSASLQAELVPVAGPIMPGDVLIQGGHPGHAVLVLDVAVDVAGRRSVLIGQSYMPAQQVHVLRNLPGQTPWFDASALDEPSGLATPEWRPFHRRDLRRFR